MILQNKEPIYLEIVSEYKKYIDQGIYKYNDKLPSVRSLAENLGINPNTVQRAYTILEDEKYIRTIAKKGIYVAKQISLDEINNLENIKKQIKVYKKNSIKKEDLINIIKEVYND